MASINTIVKRKQYLWLGIVVVGTASAIGGALYLSDVDMSGNGETVAEQEPVPDTGTRMSRSQQTREPVRPTPTILPVPWCHTSVPFTPKKVPVCMNMPRTPVSQKHPGK